jgi:hypothetical protein
MARKRRRKRTVEHGTGRTMPVDPNWRWKTLPVWLALTGGFVAGWYVSAFGAPVPPGTGDWSWWVLIAALTGFSFGLSRVVRWLVERTVVRRRLERQAEEAAQAARRDRKRRSGAEGAPTAPPPQS